MITVWQAKVDSGIDCMMANLNKEGLDIPGVDTSRAACIERAINMMSESLDSRQIQEVLEFCKVSR